MNDFKKIRLASNSKVAVDKNWSKATEDELNAYTTLANNSSNYAVLTGQVNNIVVVDYDIHKLSASEQLNYNLENFLGIHSDKCKIVTTPSGGFHVYHLLDDRTKNWKNTIGINGFVDIKTTGGYVVGPGSKINGKQYELIHDGEIGVIPDEMFDTLDENMKKKKETGGQGEFETDEVEELLEKVGFTGIKWKNHYEFDCDQRGKATECPICKQSHSSNHFFVYKNDLENIFVKNFSNKCRALKIKSVFLFTEEEKELLLNHEAEETYLKMKREFEKEVCFIKDSVCYAVIDSQGSVKTLSTKLLREKYLHLNYTSNSDLKQKSFVETWLKDKYKKSFDRIDFLPENCPKNVFNLWTGYDVEKIEADGDGGEDRLGPFIQLAEQLTENNTDYFFKWLAQLFQRPGSKPYTSPVFTSVQGTGKNTFFDLIGRMMGDGLYYETSDPDNHIFGRFSNAIEKCKFLFIDEMEAGTGFKNHSKLKGLITNERHTVEPKGQQAYEVKNLCGIAFASNNVKPLNVEGSDRRYFAYNPQKKLDSDFFNNWYKWRNDKQNLRAVYDFLMKIDLTDVNWEKDRPVSEIYQEMKYNSLPSIIKWLDWMIVENYPKIWKDQPTNKMLYDSYRLYGHTNEKNEKSFGHAIKNLEIGGFEKYKSGIKRGYKINREVAFQWLTKNGYTLSDQLEPEDEMVFSDDI